MRHRARLGVSLAGGTLLAAAWIASAAEITVGGFLQEIARTKKLATTDAATAQAAIRAAGVDLPPLVLDRPLTEGDVAAISRSLGLRVTTTRPDAPFDGGRVDDFLATFGPTIAKPQGEDPPGPYPRPDGAADPAEKGKGKKKGLVSPSDPS